MKKFEIKLMDNVLNVEHIVIDTCADSISDEGMEFMWTEGNQSCDCNRGQMIYGKQFVCGDRFGMVDFKRIL